MSITPGADVVRSSAWVQLLTTPRFDATNSATALPSRMLASVVAAHASMASQTGAFAFAWVRPPGQTQLQVLLGGASHLPWIAAAEGTDTFPVLYPPGATGLSVEAADVHNSFSSLPCWIPCRGTADALRASGGRESRPSQLRLPFDDYVAHLDGGFAWLVVAHPLPPTALDAELTQLATRIPVMRQRENSEMHRVELERAQARYREISTSRISGMWSVRVLVGGPSGPLARRNAALLCSASDLDDVGYILTPATTPMTFNDVLTADLERTEAGQSPFTGSAQLLASVASPPSRELPGVRHVTPMTFDVTPEIAQGEDDIRLGTVIDDSLRPVGIMSVPRESLNRHTFICGATGSGKSQTTRQLLESLSTSSDPVPWLVIEPAKAEYARMASRLGPDQVLSIRPGDLNSPPASLNPLEPEPGFPLQSHLDLVRALFLAAFDANEPFPQVLSQALTRCYTRGGWDLVSSEPSPKYKPSYRRNDPPVEVRRRFPTLGELQSAAREVVDNIGYGKEVAADVRGFVDVRVGSLRVGTPGRFFEGGHPLDVAALLRRNVVLELEPITNDQDKAFLMGTLLIRIVEHLRVREATVASDGLRHVLVIEEAHRLLKNAAAGPAVAAVDLFASLLAEIRAYGEGVVVVEQIPSKIVSDVIKNTALKIMHRLPSLDDRHAVGATMNLTSQQSENVVAFPPGTAAVSFDGADRPLLTRMESGIEREKSPVFCDRVPPLAAHRSLLCGGPCMDQHCTLDQINRGRLVADHAASIAWVEAVTAALITGYDPPKPRSVVRTLWKLPDREFACALATATDRAVAARRSLLQPWVDADTFGNQLQRILAKQLKGEPVRVTEPGRWLAGYFRYLAEWEEIVKAVDGFGARDLPSERHEDTTEWLERGLVLEGRSLLEQAQEIVNHPSFAPGMRRVAFGDTDQSGLIGAVRALAGHFEAAAAGRAFAYACEGPHLPHLVEVLPKLLPED